MALVAGSFLAGSTLQAQTNSINKPPGAQSAPGGAMTRRPNVDKMAKDLGLDEAQTTKFKAALEEQLKTARDLRSATNSTPEEKRTKAKAMRDATTAKVKAILTPEQFAKYEEMMPGLRRGGPGGPPKAGENRPKLKKNNLFELSPGTAFGRPFFYF